jgi:tight adherence protein B
LYFVERKRSIIKRLTRYGSSSTKLEDNFFINLYGAGDRNGSWGGKKRKTRSVVYIVEDWLKSNSVNIDAKTFLMAISILISAIIIPSLFLRQGILLSLLIGSFCLVLIFIFINLRGRRENARKEDQLESFLIDLVGNLYVTPNVLVAIQKTIENTEDPLKKEFEIVVNDTRKGVLLNTALEKMIKRSQSQIIGITLMGFIAANEKGVDLIEFLKSQIEYIREKKGISSYIRILSSGPRYTSYIIMVIPLVSLLIASFINKDFLENLLSGTGLLILIYSAFSYFIGILLINRLINLTGEGSGLK